MSRTSDELLSAYLDGELTAAEQELVERRLAEDAEFRQTHDELRALRSGLEILPQFRLPLDFAQQVLKQAERAMLAQPLSAEAQAEVAPQEPVQGTIAPAASIEPGESRARGRWLSWCVAAAAAILVLIFYQPTRLSTTGPQVAMSPARQQSAARNAQAEDELDRETALRLKHLNGETKGEKFSELAQQPDGKEGLKGTREDRVKSGGVGGGFGFSEDSSKNGKFAQNTENRAITFDSFPGRKDEASRSGNDDFKLEIEAGGSVPALHGLAAEKQPMPAESMPPSSDYAPMTPGKYAPKVAASESLNPPTDTPAAAPPTALAGSGRFALEGGAAAAPGGGRRGPEFDAMKTKEAMRVPIVQEQLAKTRERSESSLDEVLIVHVDLTAAAQRDNAIGQLLVSAPISRAGSTNKQAKQEAKKLNELAKAEGTSPKTDALPARGGAAPQSAAKAEKADEVFEQPVVSAFELPAAEDLRIVEYTADSAQLSAAIQNMQAHPEWFSAVRVEPSLAGGKDRLSNEPRNQIRDKQDKEPSSSATPDKNTPRLAEEQNELERHFKEMVDSPPTTPPPPPAEAQPLPEVPAPAVVPVPAPIAPASPLADSKPKAPAKPQPTPTPGAPLKSAGASAADDRDGIQMEKKNQASAGKGNGEANRSPQDERSEANHLDHEETRLSDEKKPAKMRAVFVFRLPAGELAPAAAGSAAERARRE